MASVTTGIHLQGNDAPRAFRLSAGTTCIWPDGPNGIAIIGSDEAVAKLRDAIDAFFETQAQEAA